MVFLAAFALMLLAGRNLNGLIRSRYFGRLREHAREQALHFGLRLGLLLLHRLQLSYSRCAGSSEDGHTLTLKQLFRTEARTAPSMLPRSLPNLLCFLNHVLLTPLFLLNYRCWPIRFITAGLLTDMHLLPQVMVALASLTRVQQVLAVFITIRGFGWTSSRATCEVIVFSTIWRGERVLPGWLRGEHELTSHRGHHLERIGN